MPLLCLAPPKYGRHVLICRSPPEQEPLSCRYSCPREFFHPNFRILQAFCPTSALFALVCKKAGFQLMPKTNSEAVRPEDATSLDTGRTTAFVRDNGICRDVGGRSPGCGCRLPIDARFPPQARLGCPAGKRPSRLQQVPSSEKTLRRSRSPFGDSVHVSKNLRSHGLPSTSAQDGARPFAGKLIILHFCHTRGKDDGPDRRTHGDTIR